MRLGILLRSIVSSNWNCWRHAIHIEGICRPITLTLSRPKKMGALEQKKKGDSTHDLVIPADRSFSLPTHTTLPRQTHKHSKSVTKYVHLPKHLTEKKVPASPSSLPPTLPRISRREGQKGRQARHLNPHPRPSLPARPP